MTKMAEIVRAAIEGMAEEWDAKSEEGKRIAIQEDEWVEFEVARSVKSLNYTLVPADIYERIGEAVDGETSRQRKSSSP